MSAGQGRGKRLEGHSRCSGGPSCGSVPSRSHRASPSLTCRSRAETSGSWGRAGGSWEEGEQGMQGSEGGPMSAGRRSLEETSQRYRRQDGEGTEKRKPKLEVWRCLGQKTPPHSSIQPESSKGPPLSVGWLAVPVGDNRWDGIPLSATASLTCASNGIPLPRGCWKM